MNKSGYSVTVAYDASSIGEWFNSTLPLKLLPLESRIANDFRRRYLKGFIKPGSNNLYIGAISGNLLFGVLGFQNPIYGNYDVLMKADTTPPQWEKSTDLLLFCLRSKECQQILESKFCRKIQSIYTVCFSKHTVISRYRKHGELKSKTAKEGGFDLGYEFQAGSIVSLKEAKQQFIQKSWKN